MMPRVLMRPLNYKERDVVLCALYDHAVKSDKIADEATNALNTYKVYGRRERRMPGYIRTQNSLIKDHRERASIAMALHRDLEANDDALQVEA